jgi:soluble epoxide hydrolase / lipid-phosphate phosphatase
MSLELRCTQIPFSYTTLEFRNLFHVPISHLKVNIELRMALQVFPDISKKVSLSDGTNYAYIRIPAVDSTKPTFLLLHGFPSSSYDWRHIVLELRERGYGVIAPDLLGYGDTDKPVEVAEYSFKRMGNDVAELIHIENLDKVIGVGHDW